MPKPSIIDSLLARADSARPPSDGQRTLRRKALHAGVKLNDNDFCSYLRAYLKNGGHIGRSCEAAHISKTALYTNLERRPLWRAAMDKVERIVCGDLTDAALTRAVEGYERPVYQKGELVGHETVYSDRLLEILLRAKLPQFREGGDKGETSGKPQTIVQIIMTGVTRDPKPATNPRPVSATTRIILPDREISPDTETEGEESAEDQSAERMAPEDRRGEW